MLILNGGKFIPLYIFFLIIVPLPLLLTPLRMNSMCSIHLECKTFPILFFVKINAKLYVKRILVSVEATFTSVGLKEFITFSYYH